MTASDELKQKIQEDFEKHFGIGDETSISSGKFGSEDVLVVENYTHRAFYDLRGELIKVIKLQGEN